MNTAVARRLALGDSVVWIGKDGYQPTGLGTITRLTAHEVEVRWDSETVMRYRRAHLHNFRHVKFASETVESGIRSLRSRRLASRAKIHRRNRRLVMRIHPGDLDQEAALLERRSRAHVIAIGLVLLLFAFGFIWLTW